jgi:(p)ppGpp synthase/HD superfamily hydrolase
MNTGSSYNRYNAKENNMSTVERALAIAREAHQGQVDKAGAPYVGHPVRVAHACVSGDAKIVALLHDVVEDCDGWSFERLRAEGFSDAVMAGIESVTKRDGEAYGDFVRRAAGNALGREVKLADLADNMDFSRIAQPTQKDFDRIAKYRQATALLQSLG